jgi:tRNA(Ile)-lysidine synthase
MTVFHDRLLQKVARTIADFDMFKPGDSVLAGVSGGPDSLALLYALLELAQSFSFSVGLAHLNHGIRKDEANHDEAFVRSMAVKLNVPFYIRKANVLNLKKSQKLSLEEAGRNARYGFYFDVAEKESFNKIAVGHQKDENAELILMNMIRGSGPKGLAGIPARRQNCIVRPLIHCSRKEIIEFLAKRNIQYINDKTNNDRRYLRNRIRHDLLPLIKDAYNPEIVESLNRLGNILRDEEEWIQGTVESIFRKNCIVSNEGAMGFRVSWIKTVQPALKRRLIRHAVKEVKGELRRIDFNHIERILTLVHKKSGFKSIDLPDRIRVEISGDFIFISKYHGKLRGITARRFETEKKVFDQTFFKSGFEPGVFIIDETGAKLRFSCADAGSGLKVSNAGSEIAMMDMERVAFPITVRNVRPGDRFRPLGMNGTQKVKKYFINNKVSRQQRTSCPVLVSGERIIWLAGHRIDDSVKVASDTRKILKVELLLD